MKEQSVTAFDVSNDSRQDKSCHCNTIYILFYASFDMSSLYASFVGCILNVQNAYDEGENVCAINLVPPKKLMLRAATFFQTTKNAITNFPWLQYHFINKKDYYQTKKL